MIEVAPSLLVIQIQIQAVWICMYVVLIRLNPIVLLDCFSVSLTFRLYCRSNSIGFHYINYGLLRKFVTNLDQNFCMHCQSRVTSLEQLSLVEFSGE